MRETPEEQLIACAKAVAGLATHRDITPMWVGNVEHDREIRVVLDSIIRRWSRRVPVTYTTVAALAAPKRDTSIEHVVPCRVLVDRMIMRPRQIRRLLERAVIPARVTREEHSRLGGIFVDHRKLYSWMLKSPVEDLPRQGHHRYRKAGIKLKKV